MKVLVTGGAGFIGSHLVEALVQNGDKVLVLDNFSTGKKENLRGFLDRVELVEGDIRDEALLGRVVAGLDVIFHQAALPSVPRSFADPLETNAVNTGGTIKLLEAARGAGLKRFIFASSSSVYGDADSPLKLESLAPRPLSPYAASKLGGEYFCRLYCKAYGLPTVSLRYFNVFGPRQDPKSDYAAVIPKFIAAVRSGREPVIYGDGKQTRDFTYVGNVVRANLEAISAPPSAWGEEFNIACNQSTNLLQLVELIAQLSGRKISPRFEPTRPGDVRHSRAEISKARELLNYQPEVLFLAGLKKTFEWFCG